MTMRWRVVEEGRATSSSGLYTKLGLLEAMAFSLNANDESSRYIQYARTSPLPRYRRGVAKHAADAMRKA